MKSTCGLRLACLQVFLVAGAASLSHHDGSRALLQTCPVVVLASGTAPGSGLWMSTQFDVTAGSGGLSLMQLSVWLPAGGAILTASTKNSSAFSAAGSWRLATSSLGIALGPGLQGIPLTVGSANPALSAGQTVRPFACTLFVSAPSRRLWARAETPTRHDSRGSAASAHIRRSRLAPL